MPSLEPLMTLTAKLQFEMIGATPSGFRLDVPFTGTATSPHWEGELPIAGTDYVTVRGDKRNGLDIRARMGSGEDVVSYRAVGIGSDDGVQELLTFETASETFGWLNGTTAVAVGTVDGADLTLEVFQVKP